MLTSQRERFSLPDGVHYLNAAYMGPLSRATQAAGLEGIRRKGVPYEIQVDDFFDVAEEARRRFARLVDAPDPAAVAIVPAVSYGMAIVARNTPTRAGQGVVVLEGQFPSDALTWRAFARRRELELRAVARPEPPAGAEEWNRRVLEAIDERTALVSVPPVHWTDGVRFDLERIGARARDAGAVFVVDGTQCVGALPFDVRRVRPDALTVAGYKWLLGPYSFGFAWLGERFADAEPLEENWIGRLGSEDFAGLVNPSDEYQPGAVRHDFGERGNFHLAPMMAAALGQTLEWGVEAIAAYARTLSDRIVPAARELGFGVEDDAWRSPHLFGLRAPAGIDLAGVQARLQERQVFVSRRGASLRVSCHVFNDESDADALVDALSAAV